MQQEKGKKIQRSNPLGKKRMTRFFAYLDALPPVYDIAFLLFAAVVVVIAYKRRYRTK